MQYFEQKMAYKVTTNIVDGCFKDCITDFKSDNISAKEETCLKNCGKRTSTQMESAGNVLQKLQ